MKTFNESIRLSASDELQLVLEMDQNGTISSSRLSGVGGPTMLSLLTKWRSKLNGSLSELEFPRGFSGPELMLKELIQRAQGRWISGYDEAEVCHCRVVPTSTVRQAIFSGAHSPEQISMHTSASTACGTCRKDVEVILNAMLKVD